MTRALCERITPQEVHSKRLGREEKTNIPDVSLASTLIKKSNAVLSVTEMSARCRKVSLP